MKISTYILINRQFPLIWWCLKFDIKYLAHSLVNKVGEHFFNNGILLQLLHTLF